MKEIVNIIDKPEERVLQKSTIIKRRPKCPYCKERMRNIPNAIKYGALDYDKIGYFCPSCERVFIKLKYEVYRIEVLL